MRPKWLIVKRAAPQIPPREMARAPPSGPGRRKRSGMRPDRAVEGPAPQREGPHERTELMWRLIRYLLILILVAAVGLVGWSYSGFLTPDRQTVTEPVDLGRD